MIAFPPPFDSSAGALGAGRAEEGAAYPGRGRARVRWRKDCQRVLASVFESSS